MRQEPMTFLFKIFISVSLLNGSHLVSAVPQYHYKKTKMALMSTVARRCRGAPSAHN